MHNFSCRQTTSAAFGDITKDNTTIHNAFKFKTQTAHRKMVKNLL